MALPPADRAAFKTEIVEKGCSVKDRFDRSSVLAYQWGQNRVGLDIGGLSLSSHDVDAVKLEYHLRLQPEIPHKEKCRYASGWQGMMGSAYNEMFQRKENTIWNQLDDIGHGAREALDKLF